MCLKNLKRKKKQIKGLNKNKEFREKNSSINVYKKSVANLIKKKTK